MKEVIGASVSMIQVKRLVNSLLENGGKLDEATLLKLYYYLRGEFIEAFQNRRAFENKKMHGFYLK